MLVMWKSDRETDGWGVGANGRQPLYPRQRDAVIKPNLHGVGVLQWAGPGWKEKWKREGKRPGMPTLSGTLREEEMQMAAVTNARVSPCPADGETMTNANEQVPQLGHPVARDFNHLPDREPQGDLG